MTRKYSIVLGLVLGTLLSLRPAAANVNPPHGVSFDHQKLLASVAAQSELRARAWVAARLSRQDGIGSADWLTLAALFDQRASLVSRGVTSPDVSLGVQAFALTRSAAAIRAAVGSLQPAKPSNPSIQVIHHTLVVRLASASQDRLIGDARARMSQAADALRRAGHHVRSYGLDAFKYGGDVLVLSVNAVGPQIALTFANMVGQLARQHGGRL